MTDSGRSGKPKYELAFTEAMKGFFTFDESDYATGFDRGKEAGSAVMFRLTITTDDTYAFNTDPWHTASATGYVKSDVLGGLLPIERGVFNLFVDAGEISGEPARHMLYRLWFADAADHPLTLSGYKNIRHPVGVVSTPANVWDETSTLYIKILAGHVEYDDEAAARLVGAGILHILPLDFAHQLTSFRVRGPGLVERGRALSAFGGLFAGQLWEVFQPRLPWPRGGRRT